VWAADPPRPSLPTPWVISTEIGPSLFNSNTGFIRAKAANVGVGYRLGLWTLGANTGVNFWRSPLFGTDEQEYVGVWNLGLLLERRFARERARTAIGLGTSWVVEPSAVDVGPGAMGFFVDARPLGLRFKFPRLWAVGLDPLSAAIRVPDTSGVPLVEVQYMTWLRLEMQP
jgi:hypothetical protein